MKEVMTRQAAQLLEGTFYHVTRRGRLFQLTDSRTGEMIALFPYLKGAAEVAKRLTALEVRAARAHEVETIIEKVAETESQYV